MRVVRFHNCACAVPTIILLTSLSLIFATKASAAYCCNVNETSLWQKTVKGMEFIITKERSLAKFWDYKFLLPLQQLRAGLTYYGSPSRLRRFVSDLAYRDRPLKIGVIGGSISQGSGAMIGHDWFTIFMGWLKSLSAGGRITGRNGCKGGTPSSFMVVCLDYSVDSDVDLVFVEFTVNDGFDNSRIVPNSIVVVKEQLIRRLLSLPGKPAVILMQTPRIYARSGSGLVFDGPFHLTSEDIQGSLAQYYNVPTLSLRTALYELAVLQPTPGFFLNQTFVDRHPGNSGHKIMADLAVHLIQETLLDLQLYPFSASEASRWFSTPPEPMHHDNYPPAYSTCTLGDMFREAVIARKGFEWVDEGVPGKPKWGYVGMEPGSWLRFWFDSRHPGLDPDEAAPMLFQFLRTYTNIGTAQFVCSGDCSCTPVEVDGYRSGRVSVTAMTAIEVTQAEKCEVVVTILNSTRTGSNKFKMLGIVKTDPSRAGPLTRLWAR